MIRSLHNPDFDNVFYILAYITNKCNYNCWYCYDKHNRGNTDIDLDTLYNFIVNVRIQTNKKIDLNLIGGEPTLCYNIQDFIIKTSQISNLSITIMTNLSQNIDFYNSLCYIKNFYITASLHIDDKINEKLYIDKIKKLNKNIRDIIVLYNRRYIDKSISLYKDCNNLFKNVEFDLLNYEKYSNDELKTYYNVCTNNKMYKSFNSDTNNFYEWSFDKLFLDVSNQSFKYWKCYAGVQSIYIHLDGKIYNCESYKDYNYKEIGHILNFKLKTNPIVCKCERCAGDFYIKKERIFNANTCNT